MKINLTQMEVSFYEIKKKKHENLLACALVTLRDKENHENLIISGITIWRSKFKGFNIEPPQNMGFKYCSGSLWGKIKQEIIEKYENESIPIIN